MSEENKRKQVKQCEICGKLYYPKYSLQRMCSTECRLKNKRFLEAQYRQRKRERLIEQRGTAEPKKTGKRKYKGVTLCWHCEKATNEGCSWSRAFIPVIGWDAEKDVKETQSNKDDGISYFVRKCPEFKLG